LIIKTIKSELSSELTPLQNQIDYLKIKLDDQEQYSRRTNLKISGIKEQGREEKTDDLVLDVINNLILKHQGVSLNYSHIGRTHRVGPPPTTSKKNRPRDIIIRFISYRDRDLVFRNKKNLNSFNQRQSPDRNIRLLMTSKTRSSVFSSRTCSFIPEILRLVLREYCSWSSSLILR
jgi:hypothetical protein